VWLAAEVCYKLAGSEVADLILRTAAWSNCMLGYGTDDYSAC